MLTRREFLRNILAGTIGAVSFPLLGLYEGSKFHFAQLEYNGDWDPRPRDYKRLMSALELRTSVIASYERKVLRLADADLFNFPFLYLAGGASFEQFSEEERRRLRKYLKLGGTLVIDDASGTDISPFDSRIREELKHILPESPLTRLSQDHVIYKSFYLLYSASGRIIINPYLEGITFGDEDRTAVFYSRNDLGGAWSEDEFGKWEFECLPGGESQRELAFRTGINLILYALTGNYKEDQIHIPFIKRRQLL
ncbi:MAG TPA: DUF4159 domain-containing protein [Thermodesulfobacteriota bacterium]|nr:DUF4159 domain-containing protein [Thermodesulfobacteriota bacterium]